MVKIGIVGYTPLNGHPYSFGCIINGFNKKTKINDYPQIESYLKENLDYKDGIKGMECTHVFCENKERTENIASTINAIPISNILEFPKNLDLILILCDYSKLRKYYIEELSKIFKLFVDKPLIKNEKDYTFYSSLISSKKVMSSSMLIHEPEFDILKYKKGLIEVNVIYSGNWEDYSSHAIDPIIKIISDKSSLKVSKYSKNSVFIDSKNLKIIFYKEKSKIPNFEYNFLYKNNEKIKVQIKSNFNSFRNGLIKLKDSILLDKSYRDLYDYESSLKIFEALKNV